MATFRPPPPGGMESVSTAQSCAMSGSGTFLRNFGAGASSGVIAKLATAPLERAKTLMQLQGMMGYIGEQKKYTSTATTIKRVFSEEGCLALYKGCGANIIRIAPAYAFKFSLTDHFKRGVARPGQLNKDLSLVQLIASTTAAGACQTTLTYPLESIRQRLYASSSLGHTVPGNGIPNCIKRTLQQEGVRGFYKGLTVGIATGAPFVGVEMSTYEILVRNIPSGSTITERLPYHFLCGSMAGVVTQTLLYPLDTIWRRMMADGMFNTERQYNSTFHCVKEILRAEGTSGFFAGCVANIFRALPAAGIQFTSYEILKQVFTPT